ncbi:MAG TPA: hypothetical protein VFK44_02855 [Bacillales bacterium]|nr:hypothetical protein [Bacillales bacterium]
MTDFPVIHTSFWDGIVAVPLVIVVTQCFKLLRLPRQAYPTIAWGAGMALSILYSHKHDLMAALFMGGFYGSAAVGTYSSMKVSFQAFRSKRRKPIPYK